MIHNKGNGEESTLLKALSGGDQEAFSYVLEQYRDHVIRICRGFVTNNEDAEDIAQEVFVQLFKSASGLRGEARLSTWLYRVAVNKALNFRRSQGEKIQRLSTEPGKSSDLPAEEASDQQLSANDHRKALDMALNALPENQKTAFILSKYDELSYEEIAAVMKLSLSAIQSLIFRARRNLQDSLRNYYKKNCM